MIAAHDSSSSWSTRTGPGPARPCALATAASTKSAADTAPSRLAKSTVGEHEPSGGMGIG